MERDGNSASRASTGEEKTAIEVQVTQDELAELSMLAYYYGTDLATMSRRLLLIGWDEEAKWRDQTSGSLSMLDAIAEGDEDPVAESEMFADLRERINTCLDPDCSVPIVVTPKGVHMLLARYIEEQDQKSLASALTNLVSD